MANEGQPRARLLADKRARADARTRAATGMRRSHARTRMDARPATTGLQQQVRGALHASPSPWKPTTLRTWVAGMCARRR